LILDDIVQKKQAEVALRKQNKPLQVIEEQLAGMPAPRDFTAALRQPFAIIAEVKRRSPSRGSLREELDAAGIASLYERNGAAAVSVLTDETFFGGSDADLAAVKKSVKLPILRKEFIIDSYQIAESRAIGADAVLLIAALLDETQLRDYRQRAESLGLAALVEIHGRDELDRAVASGARIIGVNNRNLKTFQTDMRISLALGPLIPRTAIPVSESGIETRVDIESLTQAGFHAFLIGGALVLSADIGAKLREFTGGQTG
jgi:indole-3-glycerol phosphate synthase